MRNKSSFDFSCKDRREFFLNDLLKYLYILKKKKKNPKKPTNSPFCALFPWKISHDHASNSWRGHVSGNKELRHFKISNKNPSATLKQVGLKGLEGKGSRSSIWEQGTASGKAEGMNRQKQQQAGDMTGEGPFPSKLSPGTTLSHHLRCDFSGLRTLPLTLHPLW